MKRELQRSSCPVNYTTEIVGDSWSMLIIRDMLLYGKRRYSELLESDEKIGTSVLAERLKQLEAHGIISWKIDPADKRARIYAVTEMGSDLIPILYDYSVFGAKYKADSIPSDGTSPGLAEREKIIAAWYIAYQHGDSFVKGKHSVLALLKSGRS